jgi:hypothetical protein
MGRYANVERKVWSDAKFASLSDGAKLLWLYFLTCIEATPLPGILLGGKAHFAEAMGWELEPFTKRYGELFANGMANGNWGVRLVYLPKALRYNPPANPNVVIGWARYWDELPECEQKTAWFEDMQGLVERLGEPFAKPFRERYAKPVSGAVAVSGTVSEGMQGERPPAPAVVAPAQTFELEPSKAKAKSKVGKKHTLPDTWSPNDKHYAIGNGRGKPWVDTEAEKMRDWALAKGEACIDWDARFRGWLRRATESAPIEEPVWVPNFDDDGRPDDIPADLPPGVPPPQEFLDAFDAMKRKMIIRER